ncbi:amino acid ABC transporter permease [Bifidobacterium tsurumiense]|uniref:Polar amino acid ABC transporter inner membrane subunit n=1 Tax=Bifidobacterium tsurumiense TaxID=356829 RepID=A0A087E905_9BIFI|nr:amino acid ABC transporter permease [Bifidobacterium tsurumiense]KFJ04256.1 polar amino acid ABC transporter inner membrane subunit [Bifidobacterium tsurumiense]MDY4678384.1 amino acid ABC transporter permease [Bifidobacterium tsurumiense]MSS12607.1 amino acid ABC transporter permease [Bifidobacterium tsurumiense]
MDARIWNIIIESFGKLIIPGITVTIPLTLISFAIGMLIAIAAALVQVTNVPVVKQIVQFYVWVFRGTPLLVQLFVIFFGLPSIGITLPAFPAAVIAFSLNVGAYASETLRGAILAVPQGQFEAGYTVNMPYLTIMRRIVLPQAFRSAFPALFNTFIGLVKDTSLAANITVVEMFMSAQRIVAVYYEPLVLYVEVGLIYLLFSTVLTWLQHWCERRLNASF